MLRGAAYWENECWHIQNSGARNGPRTQDPDGRGFREDLGTFVVVQKIKFEDLEQRQSLYPDPRSGQRKEQSFIRHYYVHLPWLCAREPMSRSTYVADPISTVPEFEMSCDKACTMRSKQIPVKTCICRHVGVKRARLEV